MLQRFSASVGLLAIIGNFVLSSAAQALPKSDLTVTIEGLRAIQGQVCLSLFSSGRGFPEKGDNALESRCVKVEDTSVSITFQNLKAGSYAVTVMHDANNDGELNRNGLGIPTEGFGFSRNPKVLTGPPKFGDAAIVVAGASSIQIQLQYMLGG